MWYFKYLISSKFLPFIFNKKPLQTSFPVIKRISLGDEYSNLMSKGVLFVFFIIVIFTGGFLYNNLFTSTEDSKKTGMKITKQYFSKLTLITLIFLLNFFVNELNLFMFKTKDILVKKTIPNNPIFWVFLLLILIFLFGFLTLNSKLVPKSLHLGTKFNQGDVMTTIFIIINTFYVITNILLSPSNISYMILGLLLTTSLMLNRKIVNIWIIYGVFSLFMMDNLQFLINIKVSKGWSLLHYFIYAFQIASCLFGLIKLENFNFFETE